MSAFWSLVGTLLAFFDLVDRHEWFLAGVTTGLGAAGVARAVRRVVRRRRDRLWYAAHTIHDDQAALYRDVRRGLDRIPTTHEPERADER